jgi:hypothetical protein
MNTPYVSDSSRKLADDFERRLLSLPPLAGVLFAAVQAMPVVDGESDFFVIRLGVTKKTDPGTADALIRYALEKEIRSRLYKFKVEIYQGRAGTARDEDASEPHPPAA